jgi:DNA-binding PadR family transcriptional regulator
MFLRHRERGREEAFQPGRDRHRFMRDSFGFGGRGHRHGGRSRLFDHGDLRLVLLRMIAEQPRHGYELIKTLEDQFGGAYSPSPGVVYPTLTMLEEFGFAEAVMDGTKRRFAATAEGRAHLEANKATLDAIEARIGALAADRGAVGPSPQIMRAIANLKMALRLRFAQGPIPEERLCAIAAAIDAAAAEVEKG